jgi:hypothetical protein
MIKVVIAYTDEIDDVEAAVSSLITQLSPEKNLLKNSAALIHCYHEFVESGVVEELDRRLGIPTLGTTTLGLGVSGHIGDMGLSVTVLTSNDVRFSSGISEPVTSYKIGKPVADLYERVTQGFDEKPSLLFVFPPLISGEGQGGDMFVAELDKLLDSHIPLFGALPISNGKNEEERQVLYRGKGYRSAMSLLAFYGDIKPEFYTIAVTEKALNVRHGKITGSKLNIIESINNMPARRYIESIGFSAASVKNMPLVIHHLEDGSKLFRACQDVLDNDSFLLTGIVPENAEISFSTISDKDIVESTKKMIDDIIESKAAENRSCLMYACCSRFWILGPNWRDEISLAVAHINKQIPWHFVYCGGEPFPSILPDGKVANHLQNYSVIVCVL